MLEDAEEEEDDDPDADARQVFAQLLGNPVIGELISSGGDYGDVWSTDTHTLKMGYDEKDQRTSSVEFSNQFATNPNFRDFVPKTINLRHEETGDIVRTRPNSRRREIRCCSDGKVRRIDFKKER